MMQANRLETMRGIGVLTSLEEIYLSQNGIKQIEDLENLSILKVLDLGYNFVEKVRSCCFALMKRHEIHVSDQDLPAVVFFQRELPHGKLERLFRYQYRSLAGDASAYVCLGVEIRRIRSHVSGYSLEYSVLIS